MIPALDLLLVAAAPVALALAALLVAAGFAGIVVPVLPGLPLVFGGLALAAWSDGFERVGIPTVVLLGILTGVSVVVDATAASALTRRGGAGRAAAWGAFAGALLGLPFGLAGLVAGPFLGAAAGEYVAARDLRRAGRAGIWSWLGLVVAVAARFAIAFLMLGLFAFAWFV
jgi:uncharacterized protein YqgC (DUF456 family)